MKPVNVKVKAIDVSENEFKEHRERLQKCLNQDDSQLVELFKKKDLNKPTLSANVMPSTSSAHRQFDMNKPFK